LNALKTVFIDQGEGGAQPNISKIKIRNQIILLPPLEEQQAIISIVELLFKEVDELETLSKKRIELKRSYAISALNRLCEANSAKEWKQIIGVFPEIFNDKETIKTLRETILQLAVQGKLTAKWREENPSLSATELLEQIKSEKAQLIKDKKIKAEKPLSPIEKDEIPFELPEGWVWCRMGDQMLKITDGTHHSPANSPNKGDFIYVTAKNIKNDGVQVDNITYVSKNTHDEIFLRCNPELGDILYIKDGATTGICCINQFAYPFSMLSSVGLIKIPKCIYNRYLLNVLRSKYFYDAMRNGMTGVAITRVTIQKLKNSIFPLPPITEQQTIVEKLNALMSLCDELEANASLAKQQNETLLKQILHESLHSRTANTRIPKKPLANLRQQLALHIIYRSAADPSFGKTKFEKLLHLSDYHIVKQDWGQKYEQHVAGPLDTTFTYPFLGAAKSNDWVFIENLGSLERICANKNAIEKQLQKNTLPKDITDKVNDLIDKFISHNYETTEIVSTLYAVWNNRIIRKEEITDELLKADFLAWDKQKVRYKDRLDHILKTMREEGLVPDGWGKVIGKTKK
jgi:type I restriction enzyme S subunit